jgi:GNAT superfamily N-acetyltransferase
MPSTTAGCAPGPLAGSYLRRLGPDDAAEVVVLQRCCWVEEAFSNDTLDIPALHESADQIREWLATWHAWGLWLDGRLLGMVRARRVDDDWHIGRLALVPDLRGRRLGGWLLHLAEDAGEPDCARIVLTTGAGSRDNIARYQHAGYRLDFRDEDDGTVSMSKVITGQPSLAQPTVDRAPVPLRS